ncbi:hypothetical protein M2360_001500 [Rhizobium sp. SG_E_25_P2]|jgi:hypothetical protein|uniref:hypothetical protein n=1 Tax=Rhizobium sp. SG_E_25_P2 TaxID=2879942 RepID=UPI0024731F13|nr:hypothetical protein [Rhizobium sp. SG_E_25_P2]MDH6266104.1 hypothetical protein [Rhizobium sp. SG_E_25_P2]
MSEQFKPMASLPPTNEPYRVAVRRLRWFKAAFTRFVETLEAELGCEFTVDETKIAAVFVRWLEMIDRQRPNDKSERPAFFAFAASLMFRELIADMPIKALGPATKQKPDAPSAFWPEGYVCTMFCLSVHAAAMEQEFHLQTHIAPDIGNIRSWWSFRENALENGGFAAGFLQKMLGYEPNWFMPASFIARIGDWLVSPETTSDNQTTQGL